MYRIALATLTSLLLFAPQVAAAQTLWLCALTEDAVHLACVADPDPAHELEPAPAPSAVVNGTAFPLDRRRLYTVDLWTPPSDMAFVEQLARATICYRSPGCRVIMAGAPTRSALSAPTHPSARPSR